jgi:hypothetical protein
MKTQFDIFYPASNSFFSFFAIICRGICSFLVIQNNRPVTIVSGPEIMDKFVGSSEQKLREIFDNPPEIYDHFKAMECGEALGRAVSLLALYFSYYYL